MYNDIIVDCNLKVWTILNNSQLCRKEVIQTKYSRIGIKKRKNILTHFKVHGLLLLQSNKAIS